MFYPRAGSQGEGNASAPPWWEQKPLPVSGKDKNIPFLSFSCWNSRGTSPDSVPGKVKPEQVPPSPPLQCRRWNPILAGTWERGELGLLLWERAREGAAIPLLNGTSGISQLCLQQFSSSCRAVLVSSLCLHTEPGALRGSTAAFQTRWCSRRRCHFLLPSTPWGSIPWLCQLPGHCWGSAHWDVPIPLKNSTLF